ncbi:PaaI family thioesterase [Bradyrhizobium sp. 1.29L]
MVDFSRSALLSRPDRRQATEGEFKGWYTWMLDRFATYSGPFWHRVEPDVPVQCAFRVEQQHLNGAGYVHGGCLMTFADYCLFAIASPVLDCDAVTISITGDFVDAARDGELIEGTGEVTRAGSSLIFVRGQLKSGERLLFTFSGTLKRMKRKVRAEIELK